MPKLPFFVLGRAARLAQGSELEREEEQERVAGAAREAEEAAGADTDEKRSPSCSRWTARASRSATTIPPSRTPRRHPRSHRQLRRRFALKEGGACRVSATTSPGPRPTAAGGQEIADGEIEPALYLAMDLGTAAGKIPGKPAVTPLRPPRRGWTRASAARPRSWATP